MLKREIKAYLQNKKQIKITNELKQIRLNKLVNKNISESDLVNLKELNAFPIKTLRQMAKLRNINSSMSKSNTIYELIRSEPVINEKNYIIHSVNENHSKTNDIRVQLFNVSPYVNQNEQSEIRKRLYDIQKKKKKKKKNL